MTTRPPFARRLNRDASIDSICTKCYQTIASVAYEDDLAAHEHKHFCEPLGEFISWHVDSQNRTSWLRHQLGDL